MLEFLSRPWPWYVAGPLIGLMVPLLLLVGNRMFGISSNFRHACAAVLPSRAEFFRYDWRGAGGWNLAFALGVLIGGFIAGTLLTSPEPIAIAEATRADLSGLGVTDFSGMVPAELFSWSAILSFQGLVMLGAGGFLVGFGTAYAGGCTSGHGVAGLAAFELPSLIAVVGFFIGGLVSTYLLLPLIL
ncbi:MAG: YeeE/YedE thiosulfate transporter family protein [Gemmatimonadota bacterium]